MQGLEESSRQWLPHANFLFTQETRGDDMRVAAEEAAFPRVDVEEHILGGRAVGVDMRHFLKHKNNVI